MKDRKISLSILAKKNIYHTTDERYLTLNKKLTILAIIAQVI